MYMYKQDDVGIEYKFMMDLILKKDYSVEAAKKTVKELFSEDKPKPDISSAAIRGDITAAIDNLIMNIQNGSMNSFQLLNQWDKDRGNDCITSTLLLESK